MKRFRQRRRKDMSAEGFRRAVDRFGLREVSPGYYQLPGTRTFVYAPHAGRRRRDQLAYLLNELCRSRPAGGVPQ